MSWNWMPTGVDENISSKSLIKRLKAIEERLDIIEKKLKELRKEQLEKYL